MKVIYKICIWKIRTGNPSLVMNILKRERERARERDLERERDRERERMKEREREKES